MLDGNVTERTFTITNQASDGKSQWWDGIEYQIGESHTFTYINIYDPDKIRADHLLDGTATYHPNGQPNTGGPNIGHYYDGTYSLKYSDLKTDDEGYVYYKSKINGSTYYFTKDIQDGHVSQTVLKILSGVQFEYLMNPLKYTTDLLIQAGAQSGQTISLKMVDATVDGIGLGQVDVTSHNSASASLNNIDAALAKVSEYRSSFGASQNRLEHATNNIKNTEENTQAAESRIRDADIAEEMQEFSVTNILAQAGESVLAQANQNLSNVLTLLQ